MLPPWERGVGLFANDGSGLAAGAGEILVAVAGDASAEDTDAGAVDNGEAAVLSDASGLGDTVGLGDGLEAGAAFFTLEVASGGDDPPLRAPFPSVLDGWLDFASCLVLLVGRPPTLLCPATLAGSFAFADIGGERRVG
jgi:hypothetical protein